MSKLLAWGLEILIQALLGFAGTLKSQQDALATARHDAVETAANETAEDTQEIADARALVHDADSAAALARRLRAQAAAARRRSADSK